MKLRPLPHQRRSPTSNRILQIIVGCGHFDITKVKSQALKEFAEENKNLKEAYKELQEEFTRYINGGKYEI